ncbi:MAG: DUF72 domain-containing protein [Acidobacteria bacterium]|nr:DUF72 domain-containing protein [Acidobacteriota bacterium]
MLRIGTAGWKYKDWEGIVYPKPKPRGFDELEYLSRYFSTIEINSSFYGPPRASAARQWVESVRHAPAFRFTAKLYQSFTHARKPAPRDEADFKNGVQPIMEAGKLGAILLQFPWSFKNEQENREYLLRLHDCFREFPLVLEVRHSSWVAEQTLDFLAGLGIGICNIDQPLFHRSVTPSARTTSSVGYIRLHGRNYRNWFSAQADVRERYDYLYSVEELEPWVDRARALEREAEDTYVITNNHNIGKAVVNALEISSLLFHKPMALPGTLLEYYPELKGIASTGQD